MRPGLACPAQRPRLVGVALGVSVLVHLAALSMLWRAPKPAPAAPAPVDFEIVTSTPVARPTPLPTAPSLPPAPKAAPRLLAKSARATARAKAVPVPIAAAPQPAQAAPAAKAAPMHIGLALSATTPGGGVIAPENGGAAGAPGLAAGAAGASGQNGGDPNGQSVVASFALTRAPRVDAEPDLQAYYPKEAVQDALEGQVVLRLNIDATGQVTAARVIRGAGHGFDAAAQQAALERLHFVPAQLQGRNVATQIDYTLTFLLN